MQPLPLIGEVRFGTTAVFHCEIRDENNTAITGAATFSHATATQLDVTSSPTVVTLTPTLLTGTTNVYRIAFDPPNAGRWLIDVATTAPVKTRTVGALLVRP